MSTGLNDEDFKNELLELFSLEAQEWLDQTEAALRKLHTQGDQKLDPKLVEVIQQGMTNLGGSAATVELPEVEQVAYAILPILDSARSKGSITGEAYTAIHEKLETIATALAELSTTISIRAADSSIRTTPTPSDAQSLTSTAIGEALPLDMLRQLQLRLAQSGEPSRNLVELLIERVGITSQSGGEHLNMATVTRVLRELQGLDEQFLSEVQRRMPEITQVVSGLKMSNGSSRASKKSLNPILESVRELEQAASQVNAATITQFFRGLHNFLTILCERDLSLVQPRLQAVEMRLGSVIPMVQQWVEIGRAERSAIGDLMIA